MKDGVVTDGPFIGNDVELGRGESPPRLRNFAICHESVIQNVVIRFALRPFSFEIERIVGGQQTGPRHDLGRRCPAHIPEDAGLIEIVIFAVIAFQLVAFQVILESNMPTRFHFAGVLVVIHLVGFELPVDRVDDNVAAIVVHRPFVVLNVSGDFHVIGGRHVRTQEVNPLVRIRRVGLIRRRRRRNNR